VTEPGGKPRQQQPLSRNQRIGRRVGQALFALLVASIAVASTVQITQQIFFAPATAALPFTSCSQGLRALHKAIGDARRAAEEVGAADANDEDAAVRRFRAAAAPTWRHRDGVARLCRDDARLRGILDIIERLRYSEEHGVRHQAAELNAIRSRVRKIVAERLQE